MINTMYTNFVCMPRCFLSPGERTTLSTISPALRFGKALFWWNWQTNKLPLSAHIQKTISHTLLFIRTIKSKAVTTRWPSTQVAANWSGGRWRADSFLHQGLDWELLWSAMSSSSPVVMMMVPTSSPRSSPGTQWPIPGNLLATLLWRESATQPLPFQLQLLARANSKWIKNITHHWQFW